VKQHLSEQADLADNLYSTYETKQRKELDSAAGVAAVSFPSNVNVIESILGLINNLQIQVAAISNTHRHRPRSHSGNRSPTPQRSYSSDRGRYFRACVKNDLCTYHFRFKERARCCLPGCKYYKQQGNEK
jgi:hypothetical protein